MHHSTVRSSGQAPARSRDGRSWRPFVIGLLVVGVMAGMVVSVWPPSWGRTGVGDGRDGGIPAPTPRGGAAGEDDGILPSGVTVFDERYAGVARLDPALLGALRQASADAADNGVELEVNSGWRSRAYQDRLLREAVAQYGSEAEAARWVATADTSPHVAGEAVDIGPAGAAAWLSDHGAAYGLCRVYRNEPWHFELRPEAVDGRCPRLYADPTHDPRMSR